MESAAADDVKAQDTRSHINPKFREAIHHSPFTVDHSPFTIDHSPFTHNASNSAVMAKTARL
jgi:hypothetical protein